MSERQVTATEIEAALRILAPGDDDDVTLGEIRRDLNALTADADA